MEATGISLTLNGEPFTLASGSTLHDLLIAKGLNPAATGYAVARNKELVRRKDWPQTVLAAGDTLEIVYARQGG